MGDSLWAKSLLGEEEVPIESIICDEKQQNKDRTRGERYNWAPLLPVLRTLVQQYPSVPTFKGLDRLKILRKAVEKYNEQQVSILFLNDMCRMLAYPPLQSRRCSNFNS